LAAVWLGHRRPGLATAWLAYLTLILPVSGLVRSSLGVVADRYAYLATIPLFFPLAYGLARLQAVTWQFGPVRLANTCRNLVIASAFLLIVCSWRLCPTWRDDEAVVTRAFAVGGISRGKYLTALAKIRERDGRLAEAEKYYREAVASTPVLPESAAGLGMVLALRGHPEEGLDWLSRAIASDPGFCIAYFQKGLILAEKGKLEEASQQFESALRINPYYVDARLNLARVKQDQGRISEAAEHYSRVLASDPGNVRARRNLSILLNQRSVSPGT
jgi:tetratricopeptide (TPR) repeat protein